MAGKFEIFKDKGGKFRFRLKASNGEIILSSQGYASRSGVHNGIKSVRNHCTQKDCFQVKKTAAGHRFNLVAVNGRVIGSSETYKSTAACSNGVASVRKNAPKAKVENV